jgi:hypothetical protein
MDCSTYHRLREKACETAERLGAPAFYKTFEEEMVVSSQAFLMSPLIKKCRAYIDESTLHPAHGIPHCQRVAIEAGAVLQAESLGRSFNVQTREDLMRCAQIAGLFHDIKRAESDHPVKGSLEAQRILSNFDIQGHHKRYIVAAIRNHEAFREVLDSEDEPARLVSDSLYDADKFRWGPDNFITTLWILVESAGIPLGELFGHFREKMVWIGRIKNTFRTGIGRKYGPEFIDLGMEIGHEIYGEMERIVRG